MLLTVCFILVTYLLVTHLVGYSQYYIRPSAVLLWWCESCAATVYVASTLRDDIVAVTYDTVIYNVPLCLFC
jgi:hypothetical protein